MEEIKLKKTRECLKCNNFFKCKGAVEPDLCVNFELSERAQNEEDRIKRERLRKYMP